MEGETRRDEQPEAEQLAFAARLLELETSSALLEQSEGACLRPKDEQVWRWRMTRRVTTGPPLWPLVML